MPKDMCYTLSIWLYFALNAQSITILSSIGNIFGGPTWPFIKHNIFTLTMNKIFIWAPNLWGTRLPPWVGFANRFVLIGEFHMLKKWASWKNEPFKTCLPYTVGVKYTGLSFHEHSNHNTAWDFWTLSSQMIAILELSLNSMGHSVGSWCLMIFYWLSCIQINDFSTLPPIMYKKLIEYGRSCMRNNQLLTINLLPHQILCCWVKVPHAMQWLVEACEKLMWHVYKIKYGKQSAGLGFVAAR